MDKFISILNSVLTNAPKIKYYANLVIHVIDMLDGVQDWQKENKPEIQPDKKLKK